MSATTDQRALHHLDHLVAMHETFWSRVAQEHPSEMHEFLRHHWDPWFARWGEARPRLDADQNIVAAAVHDAAQGLSGLRELAAYNGIPTPDLGTSQHGFVHPGESPMVSADYIGRGQSIQAPRVGDAVESYRDVAVDAVRNAHQQAPTITVFGYVRTGRHQKVYLFHAIDQANAWHAQLQPGYDYAAVFSASDHHYAPVAEDLAVVSGDAQVGHWFLPLALGVPAGALGGYYYRKWQEAHPGKLIPWISGDGVGHSVGGPWVDMVGATDDVARRRAWPRTKILIHSATTDVLGQQHANPAAAYVWFLEPWGPNIATFASHDQALEFMREAMGDYAAIALFDTTSPHWPNPVNWHKSDAPEHEAAIAQQIARHAPGSHLATAQPRRRWAESQLAAPHAQETTAAQPAATGAIYPYFDMVISGPWVDLVGAAVDVFRKQAQAAAEVAPGPVVGLRRDARGQWRIEQFRSSDDADDWFGHATHDPAHFTYAAYFDKRDPTFPEPLNEAIGGARAASAPGPAIHRGIAETSGVVGAHVRPDYRARAVAAATTKQREAPAPFFVYVRSPHYEVTWPFSTLEEANAYGAREVDNPRGNIDYLALFSASDRWPHPIYEWSDRAAEVAA